MPVYVYQVINKLIPHHEYEPYWCILVKMQNPTKIRKAQAEIDSVLGQGGPTFESIKKLE